MDTKGVGDRVNSTGEYDRQPAPSSSRSMGSNLSRMHVSCRQHLTRMHPFCASSSRPGVFAPMAMHKTSTPSVQAIRTATRAGDGRERASLGLIRGNVPFAHRRGRPRCLVPTLVQHSLYLSSGSLQNRQERHHLRSGDGNKAEGHVPRNSPKEASEGPLSAKSLRLPFAEDEAPRSASSGPRTSLFASCLFSRPVSPPP
jgi:hypothetical protein